MSGLAQKMFLEAHPNAIRRKRTGKQNIPDWPYLESLTEQGYFAYSDNYLAQTLLKGVDEQSEEVAAFISYLALATRLGHMCIIAEGEKLNPSAQSLCSVEEGEALDMKTIEKMVIQGANRLPQTLVFTPDEKSNRPLCKQGSAYYLQKYWHYEKQFVEKLNSMINTPSLLTPDSETVESSVKEMVESNRLLPEQAKAILQGCTQSFTIITGGPGTGKTYTAGHLIRIYYESLSEDEQCQCNITLAAPTGKAAANLQKSLLQAIGDTLKGKSLQAKTIHSLLLDKRNRSLSPQGYLHTNFLLVDECSMIDARMMTKLFRALRPGTKIILLGDKYQLPPVEVGSLFADITDAHESSVTQLKKCLRADMQELVDFAQAINKGDCEVVIDMMETGSCIRRLTTDHDQTTSKQQKTLLQEIIPHYKSIIKEAKNPLELLKQYQKYRVLTPMRRGPFGVDTLNALIHRELSQQSHGTPIMITKNDYTLNLFNGETGLLIKSGDGQQELQRGDYAAFIVFDQESETEVLRTVPALLLPAFEYAYAMSIHKSQGSEFEHVCMLLPEGSERFGREVLYTAATRAKKELTVWSSNDTIEITLKNTSERVSGIRA